MKLSTELLINHLLCAMVSLDPHPRAGGYSLKAWPIMSRVLRQLDDFGMTKKAILANVDGDVSTHIALLICHWHRIRATMD